MNVHPKSLVVGLKTILLIASVLFSASSHALQIGDRVQANSTVNVRSTAAGTVLGTQASGNQGSIIGGPQTASLSGTSYTWWQVNWDAGTDGWVAGTGLTLVPPSPTISSVSPNPVTGVALPGRVSMTLYGSNFVSGLSVTMTWTAAGGGSTTLSSTNTAFVSPTQINISVATDITPDNWTVKVTNPDGKVSNTASFTVVAPAVPAPAISSVSPNPVMGSASQQIITIKGTNFVNKPTVSVTWTGGSLTLSATQVTYVSSTQLQMAITTSTTADNWTVKVTNPDGKVSNTVSFTVNAPVITKPDLIPQSVGLNKASVAVGGAVTANWTILNNGTGTASSSTTRVRLSPSSTGFTLADPVLADILTSTLGAGVSTVQSATFTIPAGTAAGTYYVWIVADNTGTAGQTAAAGANDYAHSSALTVTVTIGSFSISLQNISGSQLPSGTPSIVVYNSGGVATTYPALGGGATVTGPDGNYNVEGYSPPTFNGTGEFWGTRSTTIPSLQTYVLNRTQPYAVAQPQVSVIGSQVQFSASLSRAEVGSTACYQARVRFYAQASASTPASWSTAGATIVDTPYVSVCPAMSTPASISFSPTVAGLHYWAFEVQTNVPGSPNNPVKTDSWDWNSGRQFTGSLTGGITLTAVEVNGSVQPTTTPISAMRGQRVNVTVNVKNQANQPVTGATINIDRSGWLSDVPALSAQDIGSGNYLVPFYVPTEGMAVFPSVAKASNNSTQVLSISASKSGVVIGSLSKSVSINPPVYGVTVVIHGFQLGDSCSSQNSPPTQFVEMARDIKVRAGSGQVWWYVHQSDRLIADAGDAIAGPPEIPSDRTPGTPGVGEQIIVVNWCDISNNNHPGHAEEVGNALYNILRTFNPLPAIQNFDHVSQGLLKVDTPIHIIAHSFGAVVAYEFARRVENLLGNTNVKISTLDPHDFDQGLIVDSGAALPNIDRDVPPFMNGSNSDNLYQTVTSHSLVPAPTGRCIDNASNRQLDFIMSIPKETNPLAAQHTDVHRYYAATIRPEKNYGGVRYQTEQIVIATTPQGIPIYANAKAWFANRVDPFTLGYGLSRIGNSGSLLGYTSNSGCNNAVADQNDVAVMDGVRYPFDDYRVFDGGLDPVLFDPTNRAGFRGQTGTQGSWDAKTNTVIIAGNMVNPQGRYLETHLTYIAPTVQSFQTKSTVRGTSFGIIGPLYDIFGTPTGTVEVLFSTPNAVNIPNSVYASSYTPIGSFKIQGSPVGATITNCYPVPSQFQGYVTNIQIRATGNGAVSIDDLELLTTACPNTYGLTVHSKASGAETSGTVFVLDQQASGGLWSVTSNALQPSTVFYYQATPATQVVVAAPATDASGNQFMNWSYCDSVAGLNCTVTMSQHRGIEANYSSVSPVNGVCGLANGSVLTSAPTVNLCAVGIATNIIGTGPWSWSWLCNGISGGENASCATLGAVITPNTFTFTNETGVALSATITSNAAVITGINAAVPIAVTGGSYSIGCTGIFTAVTGIINNNQTVCVRHISSASYNTGTTTTLTVGGMSSTFTSTTAASAGIVYTLNLSAINGTVTKTPNSASYAAGDMVTLTATPSTGYVFNGWSGDASGNNNPLLVTMNSTKNITANFTAVTQQSGSIRISIVPQAAADAGAQWRVVGETAWRNSGTTASNLPLGSYNIEFSTIVGWTKPANQVVPISVVIPDIWVDSGSYVQPQLVTINAPSNLQATADASGGIALTWVDNSNNEIGFKLEQQFGSMTSFNHKYNLDPNTTSFTDTIVAPGVTFCYRMAAIDLYGGLSGYSNEACAVPQAADTTPDSFSFAAQADVALNATVTSNAIIVAGINAPANISISGGQYSINDGSYTNAAGMISNGQSVVVQMTTSATSNTTTSATLTIGGVSAVFTATTAIVGSRTYILQPGPGQGKDIWTTSVYSYAPGGGGPGGGLDNDVLRIGGWGDQYYSLLEFNLTGMPQQASSAILYLYNSSSNGGSPTEMYLDRITQSWSWTDRLWWADRPSSVQWNTTTLPAPAVGAWYTVDVTNLYNAWQAGTYPNYGLQLRPTSIANNFNTFYSSDYLVDATLRPKLVIVGTAQ